ncbi:PQ-loop repeat-containing protein 1 [Ceratocystis lukuohia]|uniref:PQ-loop repeat-containing protein 1 n=3 Tax=Ceratocystis TaxID=5157 RepID=A0A0F8BRE3_CERFI|nr:PQ-loop repeat-containing protein 1 [Ceratocystis platani]PHH53119.1 putative membrane protein YMR010W [Ceratocystis fimbriata CBS 114723]
MTFITTLSAWLTPIFIVMSPILSYSDQALSMHRNKSSAGFSLDIPLIMLLASILKCFYWLGSHFDISLLLQAILMIIMQVILLKIALDNRPTSKAETTVPFAGVQEKGLLSGPRPYEFWQWRSSKPYWSFLLYFSGALIVLHILLSATPVYPSYSDMLGVVGLGIEAILPLPQIMANTEARSCKGFRLSVLANWLAGDAMKLFWFFTASSTIPLTFKLCGIFQSCCDAFLGVQYCFYGDGEAQGDFALQPVATVEKLT